MQRTNKKWNPLLDFKRSKELRIVKREKGLLRIGEIGRKLENSF